MKNSKTLAAALLLIGISGGMTRPVFADPTTEPASVAQQSENAPVENLSAVAPSEDAATPAAETPATEQTMMAEQPGSTASPAAPVSDDNMSPEQRKEAAAQALAEGRELYRKGFTESAIVQYRRAIELDPDNAQAYEEFGKILVDTKNQAYAITIYQKLAQLQPENMQVKEILFDLHTAYEQPREAALVGEELLAARPNDIELIKRLAEVYKSYGLTDKYADTLMRGARVSNDAQMYYDAGEAYLAADKKREAVEAYRQAVAIQPDNLEYQNGLGKALNASGDAEAARAHYDQLVKKFPQAQGLRDRQAETEIALGDRLMQTRRYVGARKAYQRAQDLLGGSNTSGTGLGGQVRERLRKAERLNGVSLDTPYQGGVQGDNDFVEVQGIIGVPLSDQEDITGQLWLDYRSANNSQPSIFGIRGQADMFNVYAGVDWKPTEYQQVFAVAGTRGIFRVGTNYQDDKVTAGIALRRDIVSYTPDAIRQQLDYFGVDGNLAYQFSDFFGLGGSFSYYGYGDDINELTYNIGPSFYPINRPNDFVWAVRYNHGGIFNDRTANPFLRFGPTNFQVDSVGTDIEHWMNDRFRYRLGYYHSFTNIGADGDTFLAGLDWQMTDASYMWLNLEHGNFLGGRVAPGVFSNATVSNYILSGGLHITF